MSLLRSTLVAGDGSKPIMRDGTAYFMILQAVETQRGLIHGVLHAHGEHCAIGSYFEINPRTALDTELLDEVAAVNDSMPGVSAHQRKLRVSRWLRWKLAQLGMSGYKKAAKP